MIELRNIDKSYNSITGITEILNKTNYVFPNSGFVAIEGRSGSGKTTLFNMISGFDEDYKGKILYDGTDIKSLKKRDKRKFYKTNLFYLKSRDNFVKNITVKEALEIYLSKDSIIKANQLIEEFKLEYLINKKIKKLSSGELQKISIIIAVSKKAKITLLDEPICNIDSQSVSLFLDLIKELSKESLVLYISHYEDDYDNYFTDIVSIEDGHIVVSKSHEGDNCDTQESSSSVSKYSLKKALILEKSKPLSLYFLFRLIIILMVSFTLYVVKVNSINVSDIYIDSLDEMSVNIVGGTRLNNDVVEKKKIYSSPTNLSISYNVYLNSINWIRVTGFGKASDFYFSNFNDELDTYDIIISDYFAYELNKNVGDELKVKQSSCICDEVLDYTTYTIKHIYQTNYKALIQEKNYTIPDEYYYVFISDEEVNNIINDSLYSYGGIFFNNAFVAPYDKKFVDNGYYNSITKEGYYDLKDDEFFGGIVGLSYFNLKSITQNDEVLSKGSDEYSDVTFKSNNSSITKSLRYKKYVNIQDYLIVSQEVFNELKEYFGINEDNVLNYTLVDTIDPNNTNTKDYCKGLDNFNQLTFLNDMILSTKSTKVNALITFYKTNYLYILSFFIFFIVLALIKVIQIEIEYIKLLKEKNFTTIGNTFLFLSSKIIVYLIISIICFLIYNFMTVL